MSLCVLQTMSRHSLLLFLGLAFAIGPVVSSCRRAPLLNRNSHKWRVSRLDQCEQVAYIDSIVRAGMRGSPHPGSNIIGMAISPEIFGAMSAILDWSGEQFWSIEGHHTWDVDTAMFRQEIDGLYEMCSDR